MTAGKEDPHNFPESDSTREEGPRVRLRGVHGIAAES